MIYRTRGEHANHYATDVVKGASETGLKPLIYKCTCMVEILLLQKR
jgi:hypothetical protein